MSSLSRSPTPRRSPREFKPKKKVLEVLKAQSFTDPHFPRRGHDILVQWIFHGKPVWWPSTVLKISSHVESDDCRPGILQYHEFQDYGAERTYVTFRYDQKSNSRYVSSLLI